MFSECPGASYYTASSAAKVNSGTKCSGHESRWILVFSSSRGFIPQFSWIDSLQELNREGAIEWSGWRSPSLLKGMYITKISMDPAGGRETENPRHPSATRKESSKQRVETEWYCRTFHFTDLNYKSYESLGLRALINTWCGIKAERAAEQNAENRVEVDCVYRFQGSGRVHRKTTQCILLSLRNHCRDSR